MALDAITFSQVYYEVTDWTNRTFGTPQERGPYGPLRHMIKEIKVELLDDDPYAIEEYADLLILLCDATYRAGHPPMALLRAAMAKMEINKKRIYNKVPDGEISEHLRGS